ncbi:rolling circle replication-associated protein [Emergencia sp.]|uniref:rolling circle replication-associated protein n=1 Tax=Emergencia sp. TaxID=1926557 RepID=UPI003AF07835
MKVVRERCIAGKTIDMTVKVCSGNHKRKRAPKMNITSEQVQKNNDRYAAKKLMRKINANFGYGDLHIVLTYKIAPTQKQAKKDRAAFIKALRREMKRQGIDLKYIAVTEYQHARIHHHLVINNINAEAIEKIWKKGYVKFAALDASGNYAKLAEYLIKETTASFRSDESSFKRRYSCSANLVTPIVTRKYVDESELFDDPQPIKGYYIDQDYCRRYEHPVTKLEHVEYIMVAMEEPRRFKKWPGEKIVTDREYYKTNYGEEQQSLYL